MPSTTATGKPLFLMHFCLNLELHPRQESHGDFEAWLEWCSLSHLPLTWLQTASPNPQPCHLTPPTTPNPALSQTRTCWSQPPNSC